MCSDTTLHKVVAQALISLKETEIDLFFNQRIYDIFVRYRKQTSEEFCKEQVYYLERTIQDFKRNAFDGSEQTFSRIKQLKKEIERICQEYESAVACSNKPISATAEELEGMHEEFITSLQQEEPGVYRLYCDYPTVGYVLAHCTLPETRKRMFRAFHNRAYPENSRRLELLVLKRHELATLLGFISYTHLDAAAHMIKTPERAFSFIHDLAKKAQQKFKKEMTLLKQHLSADVLLTDDGCMEPWDYLYVKEQYKKNVLGIEDEVITHYLGLDTVLQGMFSIFGHLFSLVFESTKITGSYEGTYSVIIKNARDKKIRGYLFLDLHPRPHKYTHACVHPIVPGTKSVDKQTGELSYTPAVATLITNFPRPIHGKPALLTHNDVTVLFHEFGHALHQMLGSASLPGMSAISGVIWDFVEVPSQLFEEWAWNVDVLQRIASHYKTGECLPTSLAKKIAALKTFDTGYNVLNRLAHSLFSLRVFNQPEEKDLHILFKKCFESYIPDIRFDDENRHIAAFLHLTMYGAKYYTYMWSRVFSCNVFSHFNGKNLHNAALGRRLAEVILERGGSVAPEELLFNFLGKKPDMAAFYNEMAF